MSRNTHKAREGRHGRGVIAKDVIIKTTRRIIVLSECFMNFCLIVMDKIRAYLITIFVTGILLGDYGAVGLKILFSVFILGMMSFCVKTPTSRPGWIKHHSLLLPLNKLYC